MEIKENASLAPHTIFKIGGPAKFFAEAKNSDELKEALKFARVKNISIFVLGAGSNILVSDKGFDGLVIKMIGGNIKINDEHILIDSGVMMPKAVSETARAGLSGLEWGIGIPGTIGGSIRGNAGCFGGEVKDIVESVGVFDCKDSKIKLLANSECSFGYRDSVFKKRPELVILSAEFRLKKGDPKIIQDKIREFTDYRLKSQDIGAKCAGCIFKNASWQNLTLGKEKTIERLPGLTRFTGQDNIPTAFLIDQAGLKGQTIGDAVVSGRHANYFVNKGGATAEEVIMLISLTKERIHRAFGVLLEEEIQYVGF